MAVRDDLRSDEEGLGKVGARVRLGLCWGCRLGEFEANDSARDW